MIPGFSTRQMETIKFDSFIPIGEKRYPPVEVYFPSDADYYQGIFQTIDYGPGNPFLKAAGVKDQPSPDEVASMLASTPEQTFNTVGLERYLILLRQLAVHASVISQSRVLERLKRARCVVGYRRGNDGVVAELAKPADVVLIDDTVLQQIFNPLR